jgi:predicted acetyltransferase
MIREAKIADIPILKAIWKQAFDDSEEYLELFFESKFQPYNTLVWEEGRTIVATLYMLPYSLRFHCATLPSYYLMALYTYPNLRSRGIMGKMLLESFNRMHSRGIPLALLTPAEESLMEYYRRFGFEKVFDAGLQPIPLNEILDSSKGDLQEAYSRFNLLWENEDIYLLKTFRDFEAIVRDYCDSGMRPKYNINGMARIIDARSLLKLYCKRYPGLSFMLSIFDTQLPHNNLMFTANDGETALDAEVKTLARLLFGYHVEDFKPSFRQIFQPQKAVMNVMLE